MSKFLLAALLGSGALWAQDVEALQRKLQQLEQEIGELKQTLAQMQATKLEDAAAAKTAPTLRSGRDGFTIRSAEGEFVLNMGGYVQSDGRFFRGDSQSQATDTFLLRRVRPILQGTLYKNIDFRIMPDFGSGKTVLQDAYLEFHYLPEATIRAGKFKGPFGLERLQSATDILFVERGLPTNLVPNRDIGFQLSGDVLSKRLKYTVGIFDGTPDGGSLDADTNNGKDMVARVFATPFQPARNDHPLKGLGFGAAVSTGDQAGPLPSYLTAGQTTFFSYASTATAAGSRTRYSPQAYYYYGRLGLMAEWVQSAQHVKKGGTVANMVNRSWQVAGSWMLTGERKSYRGIAPVHAFEPGRGGWGAWELKARIEGLNVDPTAFTLGLADAAKSARRVRAWATGVNWYLNSNVKIALDYENSHFAGGAAGGDREHEKTILSRFQVAF